MCFYTPSPTATLHASLPAAQISTSRRQRRPLCLRCPNLHPRPAERRRRRSSSPPACFYYPPRLTRRSTPPLASGGSRCEWPIFSSFCRWRRRLGLFHHPLSPTPKERPAKASLIRISYEHQHRRSQTPAGCSQLTFLLPFDLTTPRVTEEINLPPLADEVKTISSSASITAAGQLAVRRLISLEHPKLFTISIRYIIKET